MFATPSDCLTRCVRRFTDGMLMWLNLLPMSGSRLSRRPIPSCALTCESGGTLPSTSYSHCLIVSLTFFLQLFLPCDFFLTQWVMVARAVVIDDVSRCGGF